MCRDQGRDREAKELTLRNGTRPAELGICLRQYGICFATTQLLKEQTASGRTKRVEIEEETSQYPPLF